nr:MAG TPA: hypothetical protein [Caudoviricetes sp.]
MEEEIKKLKEENKILKEQLDNFIPRRRIRRVFKQFKKILEQDLENENKEHIQKLKEFIKKIEKEGEQIAGQDIKRAIEHLLSLIDLTE